MEPWIAEVVRSLRDASTLLARFRAIADSKPASPVELELLIGEAQQIYPALWRDFDAAWRGLAAHDRDASGYATLRQDELALLGVTDAGSEPDYTVLALGVYRERSYKGASFTVGAAQRAGAACEVLMAAVPEIDWRALAESEQQQIAEAGSLHTSSWFGIVKWGLAAAAVVGIGVAIYRFATREASLEREARMRSDPFSESAAKIAVIADHARDARIADLTMIHDTTCDRRVVPELARLLRASGAGGARRADVLEHEPCSPVRPSCDLVKEILATRLSHELKIYRDRSWRMQCEGLLVPGANGLVPALAILITGSDHDKIYRALRGITSTDGHRDLVPFARQPEPGRMLGVADLDDEPGDEIVFAGAELIVARISDATITDVSGPALVGACSATAAIEGDFRHGRAGASRYVVLTVEDPAPPKGCPKSGRHYYGLVNGAVAEVD